MNINNLKYDTNLQPIYKTVVTVMVKHLNYGNHLGYDSLFSLIQDARMQWLMLNNMQEISIDKNTGSLVKAASCVYESEAFFDDKLEIEFYPENIKSRSLDLVYRVKNIKTGKNVATAKTCHLFYNFTLKKLSKIPENFNHLVNNYLYSHNE